MPLGVRTPVKVLTATVMSTPYVSWTRSGHLVYTNRFQCECIKLYLANLLPKKSAKKLFSILHLSHCHLVVWSAIYLSIVFIFEWVQVLDQEEHTGLEWNSGTFDGPGRNPSKSTQCCSSPFRNQASHLKLLLLFCFPPALSPSLSFSPFP